MASLAAVGIATKDIAESCRFYRTLGLDVPEPPQGEDHFDITLPNGLRVMWDTEGDVNETYKRVTDAGFRGKKDPYDAFWGQRYANVVDPDGNVVDLFAPL